MTTTIRAHYDGKVIVPDEPVELAIGKPVRLHVEQADETPSESNVSWDRELAFIEQLRARWRAAGEPSSRRWKREDLYE